MIIRRTFIIGLLVVFLGGSLIRAEDTASPITPGMIPAIGIVIDDLGDQRLAGRRAIDLPGQLTYAVLPYTPHARTLAQYAHSLYKEVILHMPMQPEHDHPGNRETLHVHMTRREFSGVFSAAIEAVPYISGVSNHMGSLLTRHPGHMAWLMNMIAGRGDLYFLDSRTTRDSIAGRIADEHNIPTITRDVFLDADRSRTGIETQFRRLVQLARKQGTALAIGHPYPETLEYLEQEIPQLEAAGLRLVKASELLRLRQLRNGEHLWQTSLFPSQRAARNSKRLQ